MGEFATVDYDLSEHVATITLNRPESLNSFNNEMKEDFDVIWPRVREDDDVHAIVLQANGERAFSTGADVNNPNPWFYATNLWNDVDPGRDLSPKFHHRVWTPLITAVHGMCAGGGMYFVNEADIVICSEDATFFDPHANVGIVSALEPIGMRLRGVPLGDVLRWALMGVEERITAHTALRLGLVTEVTPADQLRTRAREIAVSIAQREPKAIQGTVRAIWETIDMPRSQALHSALTYTQLGNPSRGGGEARGKGAASGEKTFR